MTTTDTLTEIIQDEVRGIVVECDYGSTDIGFDAANEVATAVLPIIAEEVRKAKAEAWEECATKVEMQGTIKPGALAEIIMPKGYVIDPATKRESAEEAAHDYMRRNIGPSVGTIADRLEAAFLAGAQWALTQEANREQE